MPPSRFGSCHRPTLPLPVSRSRTISSIPFFLQPPGAHRDLHSFPTRRSSDLTTRQLLPDRREVALRGLALGRSRSARSEEHTSELQSHSDLVCRLLLEKKNPQQMYGVAEGSRVDALGDDGEVATTCGHRDASS